MSDVISVDLNTDSVDEIVDKMRAVTQRAAGSAPLGSVRVGAERLIPKLKALLPHVATDPELPSLRRIRLAVNDGLLMSCTDRYPATDTTRVGFAFGILEESA